MTTPSLEANISIAVKQLRDVLDAVVTVRTSGTLSEESYKFFELGSSMCGQLEGVKGLIATRNIVFNAATAYPATSSTISPDKFLYNGGEVEFKQGRYLLLQSYMSTTWAMYDSLSKICGTLCCVDSLAKQPKPVKLAEDFMREKQVVGSRMRDHLKGGYGWPIAVSYAVRNWLVHDGYTHDGIELFKDELSASAPFELADAAWVNIQEKCRNEYKAESTHTRLRPFPEIRTDILAGLYLFNNEVDEAMSFLLLWSVGALELQAKLLLPRDKP